MKILGVPFSDSACDYYRIYRPMQALAEQGLAKIDFVPGVEVPGLKEPMRRVRIGCLSQSEKNAIIEKWGFGNLKAARREISMYESGPNAADYDVVLMSRRYEPEAHRLIQKLQAVGVTVVYDMDDDAFGVDRMNPAYAMWGTDGAQVLRWHSWLNRKPAFEPHTPQAARAFNKKMLDGLAECCRLADAVTVTTPALADVYRRFNKNIYVLPNQMFGKDWTHVVPLKHPNEIWFGWAGSPTHLNDLKPLEEAIVQVLQRVPNSYFACLGFPQAVLDHMPRVPRDRVRLFDFRPINEYREILAGIDVIWAPSAATRFNEGKSDIRVLEAWMTFNPVVASETTYGPTVRKANGGFVARNPKDWVNRTVQLLEDADLRYGLALAGLDYTVNQRTYETQASRWLDVYTELRQRQAA